MFSKKAKVFFTGLLVINFYFVQATEVQDHERETNNFYKKFQAFDEMLSMEGEERREMYPDGYTYKEAWMELFGEQYTEYFKRVFKNGNGNFSLSTRGTRNTFLHLVVNFENLDLVKLFSEKIDINVKNTQGLTPFFNSIIVQNLEIIEFFFNHPDTDLSARDMFDNNIFHALFFGSNMKDEKRTRHQVLDFLLKEEHFIKISHLLNDTNKEGQTTLDFMYREYIHGNISITYELQQLIDKGAKATLNLVQLFKSDKITDTERMRIINLTQKIQKHTGVDVPVFTEKDIPDLVELSKSDDITDTNRKKVSKIIKKIQKHKDAAKLIVAEKKMLGLAQEEQEGSNEPTGAENMVLELFRGIVNHEKKKVLEKTQILIDSGFNLEEPVLYHGYNFLYSLILARADIQVIEILMEYKRIGINGRDKFGKASIHHLVETLNHDPFDLYNEKVLSLLLSHPEIDLNVRNRDGKTALELSQQEFIREKIVKREKELKENSEEDRDRKLQKLKNPGHICQNTFR